MILPIVQAGDPVLREGAEPVDPAVIGSPEFDRIIDSMVETMHDAPGVGLAAPQVGLPLQLVVLEDRHDVLEEMDSEVVAERERDAVPLTVLINPTLEPVGDEKVTFFEGCLSVSGWAAMTSRYRRVKVRGLDRTGKIIELDWHGWPARILQHELDHLAGTLYVDLMDSRTFASTDNLVGPEEDEQD